MGVVTTKSTQITNRDASPTTMTNASLAGGSLKSFAGVVAAGNGDDIASKYIFGSIPSNARVHKLLLMCTAITSAAMNIGLYRTTGDGGAVVDADFFASAQSIASALTGTEVTHEAGVYDVTKVEMPLWQALGLTSDPGVMYDVVGTLTAATTAAGTVAIKAEYAS